MNRRTILSFALLAGLAPAAALAQTKPVRIGVINDMSSVYSDFQGPGSVLAAQMAVEDFNKQLEPQGRGHLRRSPEQARYRIGDCAALVSTSKAST